MKRTRKVFAICDLEEAYVVHLADYLNEKADLPFQVLAFTNLDSLIEYAQGHPIEILLISTEAMTDEVRKLDVRRIIILSDGEAPDLDGEDVFIDKYQDSDSIARLVCSYAGESLTQKREALGNCRLLGVYSPVSRCGKTQFALTLAQEYAQTKKVLYLNMESCSGFEELFKTTWREDLADLLFAAGSEQENFPSRLESVVKNYGGLDICPPAFFPEDIREITTAQWVDFFAQIAQCGAYEVIVLDIGSQIRDVPEMLKLCSRIYMPVLSDPVARAKVEQFRKNLIALSMESLLDNTIRMYLPEELVRNSGSSMLDDLLYGHMGQFVRRLLQEEMQDAA